MAPVAPPKPKPGQPKPGTVPGPSPRPTPTPRPPAHPDPFRPVYPGTDPGEMPKPKACRTGRSMETHARAEAVVDRLLEVKMYARPDPATGAKFANPEKHWKKCCHKCGKPYVGQGGCCPSCKPMAGTSPTPPQR